jgi:hypothetical protein
MRDIEMLIVEVAESETLNKTSAGAYDDRQNFPGDG